MRLTLLPLLAALSLAGCVSAPPPAGPATAVPDTLACGEAVECTTKVSRTLLFVFDYAEVGAPLLQREGRRLFTPPEAPLGIWPLVQIQLPEPANSRFEFASQCRVASCRYGDAELQAIFRRYLEGEACLLRAEGCR